MVRISRILCPVDFSRFSLKALEHAGQLARWFGSRLTACYVISGPELPLQEFPPYLSPAIEPESRERIVSRLKEAVRPLEEAGIPCEAVVADGRVAEEILRLASVQHADLIVAGTHGHGGVERFFLGSVTEKLLRKASVPVLTVPAGEGEGEPRPLLFTTIVAAVDFSQASLRALSFARSIAAEARAHLLVAHVLEHFPEGDEPRENAHFNVPEYRRLLTADAETRLRQVAIPRPGEAIELVVVSGRAWRAILHLAAEREASLIVMGATGRSPVDRLLFGSATSQVTRGATCPVLTLRA